MSMRVLPPLIIEEAHITEFVERLSEAARHYEVPQGRRLSPAMPTPDGTQEADTANLDEALGFTLAARHARGRLVRLGPVLDEILSAHDYPAPIARILSEALTLTALLGAMLKDAGGQLTLQAQTEAGIVDLLVCDYQGGELRGYVRFDMERLAHEPLAVVVRLVRQGLSRDHLRPGGNARALSGHRPARGRLARRARPQSYFNQSEQIPSLVRLAVSDTGHVAGGILLQHLPEGEEGRERLHTRLDHPEWEHCRALAETVEGERTGRREPAARHPGVAAVPRGGGDSRPAAGPPDQGLPLQFRAYPQRDLAIRPSPNVRKWSTMTASSASIANSARAFSRSRSAI